MPTLLKLNEALQPSDYPHATLPLQKAAELLNVSPSYLESLLDAEQIPSRVVGDHCEILIVDLIAYKKRSDAERENVLEELSRLGQEIGEGI